jgi:hypothetical protein
MDTKELALEFWRNGYLYIENFFDTVLMDRLDIVIRDHYGVQPAFEHSTEFLEKAQTEVVPWFPQNEGASEHQ